MIDFLRRTTLSLFALLLILTTTTARAAPLQTVFTYQGERQDNGVAANDSYDFEIALYGLDSGGNALATQTQEDVPVQGGIFSLELDFGLAPFTQAEQYWLKVRVRAGHLGSDFPGRFRVMGRRVRSCALPRPGGAGREREGARQQQRQSSPHHPLARTDETDEMCALWFRYATKGVM